jgi:hypothetical protein
MGIRTNTPTSVTVSELGVGSSSDLASVISDESGTGVVVFNSGATFSDAVANYATLKSPTETANIVASGATGTININVETSSVWYYTSNATANHTLNFRYSDSTTLASKMSIGEVITVVWINTNGATAYYPSVIQIDGSTVTPKVPVAISSGNVNATDIYSFTVIKTSATPTYLVAETQTKFA